MFLFELAAGSQSRNSYRLRTLFVDIVIGSHLRKAICRLPHDQLVVLAPFVLLSKLTVNVQFTYEATLKFNRLLLEALSIKWKVILLLLVPGIAVISLSVFFVKNTKAVIESSHWVEHTHAVIADARHLESLISDLETGQRGFLISGQEIFLEPFNSSVAQWNSTAGALSQLVSDNPSQQVLIEQINEEKARWLREVGIPAIELRR